MPWAGYTAQKIQEKMVVLVEKVRSAPSIVDFVICHADFLSFSIAFWEKGPTSILIMQLCNVFNHTIIQYILASIQLNL